MPPAPAVPQDHTPRIQPMRWWHVDEVVKLDRELFAADAWAPELFWAELTTAGRSYWVAEDAGRVCGFAGLAVAGPDADVQTVGVDAAVQGRGVGRALMTTLIDVAAGRGAARLMLEVREDAVPARRLYESLGFTVLGRRRGYYADDVTAVLMRLDVRAR